MGNPEEQQRNQPPPYIDPSLIINTRLSEIERQQREDKEEQKKHDRSQRNTNRWLAVFTGLLFITSGISDLLILRQVSISKQNAAAAMSAAETAKGTLDQNRLSAAASIEASRTDQRAWVGITEAATPPEIKEGANIDFAITLLNSGKTPALDVSQTAGWRLLRPAEKLDIEYEIRSRKPIRLGVIQPGGRRILGFAPGALTKQQVDGLADHSMTFYVFGRFVYTDVFRTPHLTTFCIHLGTAAPMGFSACDTYNDAN